MKCKLTYVPAMKSLVKELGRKNALLSVISEECIKDSDVNSDTCTFTNDFIEYYKKYHNGEEPVIESSRSNSKKTKEIMKFMLEYHNFLQPNINYWIDKEKYTDISKIHGYVNESDAIKGRRILTSMICKLNEYFIEHPEKLQGNPKVAYRKQLMGDVVKQTCLDLSEGNRNKASILFKESGKTNQERLEYFKSKINEDSSITTINKIALFSDLIAGDVFENVIKSSKVSSIFKNVEDTYNKDIEESQLENDDVDLFDNTDETLDGENERDTTLQQLDNKMGTYNNFMKHFDKRLVLYLNSLPRFIDNTQVEDRNNSFGISETMDAKSIITLLTSAVDCSSLKTMMYGNEKLGTIGIKQAAQNYPGFASLSLLYEKCQSDHNFMCMLYRNIGKSIISKAQTTISSEGAKVDKSNKRSSRRDALTFILANSFKNTALAMGTNPIAPIIEDIVKSTKQVTNDNDTLTNKLISLLTKEYQKYFPTLNERSIYNYVHNNRSLIKGSYIVSKKDNIKNLCKRLNTIHANAKNIAIQYANRQEAIKKLISTKYRAIENNESVNFDAIDEQLESLYRTDYITNNDYSGINQLINDILSYSDVTIELNSVNVHRNNSSDVINSSWLTYMQNMLNSDEGLSVLAKDKFQSSEYELSNILVERDGHLGLFKKQSDGIYVPTSYAKELLDINLFDGALDTDGNQAVLYSEMSKGDYTITAYINFFKENKVYNGTHFSQYFLRVMSDAPKTFTIRAPRYNTDSLLKLSSETDKNLTDLIDNLPVIDVNDENYINYLDNIGKPNLRGINYLVNKLTSRKIEDIELNKNVHINESKPNNGDTVTITYAASIDSSTDTQTYKENGIYQYYILEGVYSDEDGKRKVKNVKFKAFLNNDIGTNAKNVIYGNVKTAIKKAIDNKGYSTFNLFGKYVDIKRIIDTKHTIYKQFKNAYLQELTDMATAIDVMFETDYARDKDNNPISEHKHIVLDDNRNPILKSEYRTKKGLRQLYANYHYKKSPFIIKNGKIELTGNVFKSGKFTLFRNDKLINYGNNIAEEVFNLFYGEGETNCLNYIVDANGKVQLDISQEQDEVIQKHLTEFIVDYVADCTDRISAYNNVIDNLEIDNISENSIRDFALNYYLMYMSCDELFEGNNKFYKDAQTSLKRAKEIQASGVPYAMTDLNFDTNLIDNEGIKLGDNKVKRNFTAVTVTNTVLDEDEVKESVQKIVDFLNKRGRDLTDKEIKNITKRKEFKRIKTRYKDIIDKLVKNTAMDEVQATNYMLGYFGTCTNDAQSYITYDEWKRRIIGRGQYHEYKDLIAAIEDESKPVDAKMLEKFVQVQKNFYYDVKYDKAVRTHVPRQIKNAEFVLIPRFIKGTQLERVAELMAEHNIDQLNTTETSKAGKKNVLTLWDNQGNLIEDDFNDGNVESAKEIYSYNFLYTQQETPQHMDAQNKAGIQIMKKILDNIPVQVDRNGNPTGLYKKKLEFFKLYTANITESYQNFCKELGLELDENGNIKLNNGIIDNIKFEKLFDRLLEEASRSELSDNLLDYLTLTEVVGSQPITKMPFFASIFSKKLENIAQSAINSDITRQKLPGFHAAQITNVGWSAKSTNIDKLTNAELAKDNNYKTFINSVHPNYAKFINNITPALREEYKKWLNDKVVSYAKKLKYHPNGENIVEIMLPKSVFNFDYNYYAKDENGNLIYDEQVDKKGKIIKVKRIDYSHNNGRKTDEELLEEINKAGVDKLIGYRIPTEGKQSICTMKIVGFVDDALGSTIIVPDDWVAQTGSDFDIDSVYAITYTTRLNYKGEIQKIQYNDNFDVYSWFRYVANKTGQHIEGITDEFFEEIKERGKQIAKDEKEEFVKNRKLEIEIIQTDAWKALPDDVASKIKQQHANFKEVHGKANTKNLFAQQLEEEIKILNDEETLIDKYTEEERKAIKAYKDIRQDTLNDVLGISGEQFDYNEVKSREIRSALEQKKLQQFEGYKELAEQNGLESYEEYINKRKDNIELSNSRSARCNKLLETMIDILSDDASLEENVARSNFEDIIAARDKLYKEVPTIKQKRDSRSPYNFFDQADYQEDVMSGAKLKAFSVTRDTFNSICNTVRPRLIGGKGIAILYDNISLSEAKKHFDNVDEVVVNGKRYVRVIHDTIGWSKDDKNIEGKLVTVYSSQTTAHILDAVKEGAIPNVNDLTFGVYKLLPDVGSNYDTTVAFMMQPGITRIVEAYNSNKSIYNSGNNNPIHTAIKEIAIELGITIKDNKGKDKKIDIYTPINDVITELRKEYQTEFNNIFGCTGPAINLNLNSNMILPLMYDVYKDRIINEQKDVSENQRKHDLLVDLGVVLQYQNLSNLSTDITSLTRVCNPDKFGAKQSIYATNKVFDDIQDLISRELPLKVGDKSLLEAIYPDIELGLDGYLTSNRDLNTDSAYPPLAAFLKMSTAFSVKLNQQLFKTQSPAFRRFKNSLENYLTHSDSKTPRMNEELDRNVENYIMSVLYNSTPFMTTTPIVAADGEYAMFDSGLNKLEENRRIYGYGYNPIYDFNVDNINRITTEEIEKFALLTPTQQIDWLKKNLTESGIFEYIDVNLFNDFEIKNKGVTAQRLSFNDTSIDVNNAIYLFRDAFFNTNPLIKTAAINMIKYSVAVEGLSMKKRGISSIIHNDAFLDEYINDAFFKTVDEYLNDTFLNTIIEETGDKILDSFVRGNARDMKEVAIAKVKINKTTVETDEEGNKYYNYTFELPIDSKATGMFILDKKDYTHIPLITKYRIGYNTIDASNNAIIGLNKYVKLTVKQPNKTFKTQLYKITDNGGNDRIYIYPISELENKEFSDISVNESNNTRYTEEFYTKLINEYESKIKDSISPTTTYSLFGTGGIRTQVSDFRNTRNEYIIKKSRKITNKERKNLRKADDRFEVALNDLADDIIKFFNNPNHNKKYYVNNIPLTFAFGFKNQDITIDGKDYLLTYERNLQGSLNRDYRDGKKVNTENNEQLRQIVTNSSGNYAISSLYSIKPVETTEIKTPDINPNRQKADFIDLGDIGIRDISRTASQTNDIVTKNINDDLQLKGITHSKDSIKANSKTAIENIAIFVENASSNILDKLNSFYKIDEHYYPINSPETIKAIQENEELKKEFLKTLLDAKALIKKYNIISNIAIDSQPEELRGYLRRIRESINNIKDAAIINDADNKYLLEYVSKLSNNPLIKSDIISLFDGYHSTSSLASWIADTQDNANPLIQIVLNEVMSDVRAKDHLGRKKAREFRANIEKLISKVGPNFNISHLIDDSGRTIRPYNQEFEDKIEEFTSILNQIAIQKGRASEEYIKEKLKFDEFKIKYINREVQDSYYIELLKLDREIFGYDTEEEYNYKYPGLWYDRSEDVGTKPFRDIYLKYLDLKEKQFNILRRCGTGILNKEDQEAYDKLDNEIYELRSYYKKIGDELVEKSSIFDSTPDKYTESYEAAKALEQYITAKHELQKKYFKYVAKPAFKEDLDKNLQIIEVKENRNPITGQMMTDPILLQNDEEYLKAKKWIQQNARYVPNDELRTEIIAAFNTLKGEGINNRGYLNITAIEHNAYDEFGYINPKDFTDAEIKHIKKNQEFFYRDNLAFNDKSLIKMDSPDETVYKSGFYSGMRSSGASNRAYIDKVKQINEILKKHYSKNDGYIHFENMSRKEIKDLTLYYNELENITRSETIDKEEGKRINKFIKDNVEFNRNEPLAEEVLNRGNDNVTPNELRNLLYTYEYEYVDGKKEIKITDGKANLVPRSEIFGYITSSKPAWINTEKTKAKKLIKENVRYVQTPHYWAKRREMQNIENPDLKSTMSEKEYKAWQDEQYINWYNDNHIYNPNTQLMEPLPFWNRIEIGNLKDREQWEPKFNQTVKKARDGEGDVAYDDELDDYVLIYDTDVRNPEYIPNVSLIENYKKDIRDEYGYHDSTYDNKTYNAQTDAEREIIKYINETLTDLATTASAQRYIGNGYLPNMSKEVEHDKKWWAKEVLKTLGINTKYTGLESWHDLNSVNYANDVAPTMPMLHKLADKTKRELIPYPKRTDFATEEEYLTKFEEVKKENKEIKKENEELHKKLLNKDYISAIEMFITQAVHYNAIQDNKYVLYHCQEMLDKLDTYVDRFALPGLQKNKNSSIEGNTVYVKQKDTKAQAQISNFIRRLVYDEWKSPHSVATRVVNTLQNMTSAKFMMMNITGGIANVTVGYQGIIAEAAGGEYFDAKDLGIAWTDYVFHTYSYFANMYTDKSTSFEEGMIKFMNIVDFNKQKGTVDVGESDTWLKKVRNVAYSPQTMGEHLMQNNVLLAMLRSHKVFLDPSSDGTGRLKYRFFNKKEYIREYVEDKFRDMLTDSQKSEFDALKQEYKDNPDKNKQLAWNRDSLISIFARTRLKPADKETFLNQYNNLVKEATEEFDKPEHPTLRDQFTLNEETGYIEIKQKDSVDDTVHLLADMDEKEAYKLIGKFQGRVISVNKKIHGVYDKIGAARLESQLFGSIIMQYHKHIYPGIMKRWRTKGYFNEERGTKEKGYYISLMDMILTPYRDYKDDKEKLEKLKKDPSFEAVEGINNLFQYYKDALIDYKLRWATLDEVDKANVARAINEIKSICAGILIAIAINLAFDDKDKKGLLFNLCLYEADRYVSEIGMYNPIGGPAEIKTLYSSPVAAQTGITDSIHMMGEVCHLLIDGEDYEPNYKTGLYAGRNKLEVRFERQIPIWRAYKRLTTLDKNNKYYRMGDTTFGIFNVNKIADDIESWF